ncbi:MAG: nuclear transport factor 2 family protein [Gemmatimonadota bacterium]
MRRRLLTLVWCACAAGMACSDDDDDHRLAMSPSQVAELRGQVETALRAAYDLSKPDVEKRMLALYPDSGRVVSASAGRVTTSRDTLEAGIRYFWRNVGVNMRGPQWIWDAIHVDVLSSTYAVVTGSYHIPHKTPRNLDHVIAGAMTAVFAKRDGKWVIIQEHLSDVPAQPNDPSMEPVPAPGRPPNDND